MYVSRLAGGLLAAGLAFWCGTGTAAAQLLYEQAPSGPTHNYAYPSSPSPYGLMFHADSFQLAAPTLLSRVTWWGVYEEAPPWADLESFVIRLYADNGGQPGAVIATFETGRSGASRTATGRSLDFPGWSSTTPKPEYSFSYKLTTPFALEANTTYWISIVDTFTSPYYGSWYWSHSADPDNPGMMVGWDDISAGPWYTAFGPWIDGVGDALVNAAFRLESFAPPSYATYGQPRLIAGGGVASTPAGTEFADSFELTAAGGIKRIVWWGSYADPAIDTFTIRIYADDAGQPGTELANHAANTVRIFDLHLGNLSDTIPGDPFDDIGTWQFEYVLPTPLAVQAGTRYWVSIVNDRSGDPWLWQASDSTQEPGLQFRAAVPPGSWAPQTSPIHDVAFRIETAPPPAFEQRPTHEFAVHSVTDEAILADWFQFTETTDITRISWLGGYYMGMEGALAPGADDFTVQIFADNGGQPGSVIATYTPGDQVSRTLTGLIADVGYPFYSTVTPEYSFSMALPAPLTFQANTRYWFSVSATRSPNYSAFMWEHGEWQDDDTTPGFVSGLIPLTGSWWIRPYYLRLAFSLER